MSNDVVDKNYSLRPRTKSKGKYQQMLGIANYYDRKCAGDASKSLEDGANSSTNNSAEPGVYLVPIVVSSNDDNCDVTEEGTLEIEISGPVESVTHVLPDEPAIVETTTEIGGEGKRCEVTISKVESLSGHALNRIEEILRKNDQLIEKMHEVPLLRNRRKRKNAEGEAATSRDPLESTPTVEPSGESRIIPNPSSLTMESLKEMVLRPLSSEEQSHLQELLAQNRNACIVEKLFGSEAVGRVRRCPLCRELVPGSDSEYAAHHSDVHGTEATFACELCGDETKSAELYQAHLRNHFIAEADARPEPDDSGKDSRESGSDEGSEPIRGLAIGEPCVCDICGKTLKHQKSLYSHRRTHTDSKAVCHICGTTLKSSRYLHHHLLLHKDVEKPHKCDKCGKAFLSSSALKVHHYYNHEGTPGRFQCGICGKSFKAKQGLQFHMDSHSSELRYECSFCHKRFRGFKTCRVHELRHREANEPGKFHCDVCGKCFKTRQTLKNHEDVHASFNRYQCSLCDKRFKLRKSCLAHIRTQHADGERGRFRESTVTEQVGSTGEIAVESLLNEGEEYVVTLEEMEDMDGQHELMVPPDAHVECEVTEYS